MNKKIIKMVILQEKIDELFLTDIFPNNSRGELVEKIKSSSYFDEDLMDILFATYFVRNVHTNKNSVVNFIEDFSSNKDILYNCFLNNKGFANEISYNFMHTYENSTYICDYYNECSEFEKKTVNQLSPIFLYKSFDFLSNFSRFTLSKIFSVISNEEFDFQDNNDVLFINNEKVLKSYLIGDAYTYMNLNNNGDFNNHIYHIEQKSNDINNLYNSLNGEVLYYYLMLSVDLFTKHSLYSDLYKECSKINKNYLNTLKNLNPYYILDEIDDYNQKKYLIK